MKVVHRGKSNGNEPEYLVCANPDCQKTFVWKYGCLSREIIDERGGTLTMCLDCSKAVESGHIKFEMWPSEKKFLKSLINKQNRK